MSRIVLFEEKEQCCGCGACLNVCSKSAISMKEDEYGFTYPHIDEELCIGCGQCKKVCSYQDMSTVLHEPIVAYAAGGTDSELIKKEGCTEENLWNCIIAFREYSLFTASGLPFSCTLKIGPSSEFTKELFIDRRENSKSLTWSSVRIAFQKAMEKQGTVFASPKEIADVRGVSYSYSLLWGFGVISVPEKVKKKLREEK